MSHSPFREATISGQPSSPHRPSGAVPFPGIALTLLVGVIGCGVLGFGYGLACVFTPVPPMTWLATALIGLAGGWLMHSTARWGKIRNEHFMLMVGGVAGIVTIYYSWIGVQAGRSRFVLVTADPVLIWQEVRDVYQTPLNPYFGIVLPGWMYAVLWILEILFFLLVIAGGAISDLPPFCELCRRWTKPVDRPEPLKLPIGSAEHLESWLTQSRYEALEDALQEPIDREEFVELTLYACPVCGDSRTLLAERIEITIDEDGDPVRDVEPLGPPMELPESVWNGLREFEQPNSGSEGELLIETLSELDDE